MIVALPGLFSYLLSPLLVHSFFRGRKIVFVDMNNHFEQQLSPSVQLHFDGSNHWTMSFSTTKEADVYYIDNLGANLKDLRNNVKIQLSQIYKNDASKALQVKIPRVQQQPNSYDCGLFAIANVVEFCFSSDSFNPRIIWKWLGIRARISSLQG